jgi:hypothetical protein
MQSQKVTHPSAQAPSWQEVAESGSPSGDDALAAAVAAGTSIKEAARAAGVSERTAYRRQQDPEFRRRVAEIRSSFLSDAVGRLAEASTEAVSTLKALLNASSDSVRLSAARAILEFGPKLREHTELAERISALEKPAAEPAAGEADDSDKEEEDDTDKEDEEDEDEEEVGDDDDEA